MTGKQRATQHFARKVGFSLIAAVVAAAAGFVLAITWLLIALGDVPSSWRLVALFLTAGLVSASIWLARRSRISLWWISWPLLGAAIVGFLGFWAWLISVWEPMD